MFTNIEELRDLIRQGKSNEEIIKARLQYLNSDEYKQDKKTERYNGETQVYYHEGFIGEDMLIAADGGDLIFTTLYRVDTLSLYNDLINIVRKNMDKKGNIPLSIVVNKVTEYFSLNEDSQYKEILGYIKEKMSHIKNFARDYLPIMIYMYKNSKFEGSFTEFAKLYIWNNFGTMEWKGKIKKELQDWKNSIDWGKCNTDPIINLSELKGTGITMCTEKSMVLQNCATFMGYESYFLGGKLKKENKSELHNFVVVKQSNGKFSIVDGAQYLVHQIEGIDSPEDLKYLKNIKAKNGHGEDVYYYSHLADKKNILES